MRVMVIGAGAVGSYFGGRLAAAGTDVTFVARAGRATTLGARGLLIAGSLGAFSVPAPRIVADPRDEERGCDVVLLCVKTYDTAPALETLALSSSRNAVVVSLQNGIDAPARLGRYVENPVAGLAFVAATIDAEGDVVCVGTMSSLVAGRFPEPLRGLEAEFAKACSAAGFGIEIADDIDQRLWRKFVLLSTNAALTSLSRAPAGFVYHDPDMRRVAAEAVAEAVSVANAEGIAIEAGFAQTALDQARGFPAQMYASMFHDLKAGRKLELEHLSGSLVRAADRHGLAVPVHRTAYAALKPFAGGHRPGGCEGCLSPCTRRPAQ